MDPSTPFTPSIDRINHLAISNTTRKRTALVSPESEQLKRARTKIQSGFLRQVELRSSLLNEALTPEEKQSIRDQIWTAQEKKSHTNLLEEFERAAQLENSIPQSRSAPLANKLKLNSLNNVQSMDGNDHTAMYKWCKQWDETLSTLMEVDTSAKIDITKSKLPQSLHTDFDTAFSKYEHCWALDHEAKSIENSTQYVGMYCGTRSVIPGSVLVVNWLVVLSSMLRIIFERLSTSIFIDKIESHTFSPGTSMENHIVEFDYLLKSLELAQGGILPRQAIRYFLSGLPEVWLHSAGESDWSNLENAYAWARNKSRTATMVADLDHSRSRGTSQINAIAGSTCLFPTEQKLTSSKVIEKLWKTAEPKQLKHAIQNKQALQQFMAGLNGPNASSKDKEEDSGDEAEQKTFTTTDQIHSLTESMNLQQSAISDLLCQLERFNGRPISCSFCPYKHCFRADGVRKNDWKDLKNTSETFSHKSHECPELKKHSSAKKGWCGRCTNFGHSYFECPLGLGARKHRRPSHLNEERGERYRRR